MNTGNSGADASNKLNSKKVILIIVAALILLAIIWIVKESQQNNSDIPPSGTVGEIRANAFFLPSIG